IRDNETFLREAQRIGNLGIYEYDIENDRWTSSRELDRIFGIEATFQKTFSSWLAMIHPDCRGEMEQQFTSSLSAVRRFDMEYRIIRHHDGVERWVYGTGEFTGDSTGKPLRVIGTIQDITERKQTERKLIDNEVKYRNLFDSAMDAIFILDMNGYFIDVNKAAYTRLGYTKDELLALHISQLDPPEFATRIPERLQAIREKGAAVFESAHLRKDGSIMPVEINSRMYEFEGKQVYFSVIRDITERKQAEAALREVETIFNLFLEYSPIYVFFKDENIMVSRVSRNFEKLLGRPLDQIIGKNMEELFPRDLARKMVADDRKVLCEGVPIEIEEELGGRSYRTFKFPIYLEGRSPLLAGFTIDITDITEAQREVRALNEQLELLVAERTADLEKSNEELASFCYTVSHELRAPIVRLQGFCSILGEVCQEADETATFMASRIENASRQLQSVVDSILMLSRLSRMELSPRQVDLSGMAERKLALLLDENPERQVEVVLEPEVKAVADASLMEICMDNLIGNAFKYTGNTPDARIEFGVCDDSGEEAYFVRDNGAGFDMSYYEKLYAPFQRLHQHKEFPGMGIGLATVKRIIERHGGHIWAESKVGEGSTFFFTLGGKR
ncbi:MAG TPA: PAS domain S-box protein, partial [Geobacteraceae bacterium]|nr:PAS domain S-box protein [Geobacteraceae bacterium]